MSVSFDILHCWKIDGISVVLQSLNEYAIAQVYIMNAYLIGDEDTRIILLTKCKYFAKLVIHSGEGSVFPVTLELLDDCPPYWLKGCKYAGQYGSVKIPKELAESILAGSRSLQISYADEMHNSKPLKLIDSRISKQQKATHKLAVCVYPVIQVTDWTELVRFMEMWIAHGVTKFFFIIQSFSKEFDAMLRIYENDHRIDVERVHWGVLPTVSNISTDDDPNGNVNRGEQVLATNDCLLRARGQATYVATVDLDEVFVIRTKLNMLQTIDLFFGNASNAGAVIFRSAYATFNNEWKSATHPIQLDFNIHREVMLESVVWNVGQMSKLIVRPEMIKVADVHYVKTMEKQDATAVTLDPEIGKIYHLRLVRWMYAQPNTSSRNYELQKYVPIWMKQYKQRLRAEIRRLKMSKSTDALTLLNRTWPNRGALVMEELENCMFTMMADENTCPAHYKCTNNLQNIRKDEWLYAKNTWTVL
uniref:Glycosyltransferase family 92 protein n=1 Tax=Parascaris univalens TaxID=6257 RepID=A0A914ZQI6_PARUN